MSDSKITRLTCCCCGNGTFGRQWRNRDTGFGICPKCILFVQTGRAAESADEMQSNYGTAGHHHSVALARLGLTADGVNALLTSGDEIFAKEYAGDWIKIDAARADGMVRAADHLSGFNSGIVGAWFEPADIEVQ